MGFEVFGVGVPEMLIIAVVALIFLGPERLPEVARTVGGWVREIRAMSADAASVWQETLGVSETIRDSIRLDGPRATGGTAEAAASVPYTPPVTQLPPKPLAAPITSADLLEYPAPYAEPPAPPPPDPATILDYPAPFGER